MVFICFLTIFTTFAATTVRINRRNFSNRTNVFICIAAILMICLLGLRIDYNDTSAYITGFMKADTISDFFGNTENLYWTKNPLFGVYTSLLRSVTDNYHIYFMIVASFIVISFLNFFMHVCENEILPYSIFLYFTFGTYFFSLGAMKQSIAMAILTYAILALQKKQRIWFIVFVIIAGLFHTYAFLLLILILFDSRPWHVRTWILILATIGVMYTFEGSLLAFLRYADAIGKDVADEGLFHGEAVNTLRAAVYGVTPLILLLGNRRLRPFMEKKHFILIHMSIFSFMFMLLGTISGANLFGRMARYFEIGTLVMLPWSINKIFNEKSAKIIYALMIVLFFIYFLYDYQNFDSMYQSIPFWDFIRGVV